MASSVVVRGYDESINGIGGLTQAESLRAQGTLKVDMHYMGSGKRYRGS